MLSVILFTFGLSVSSPTLSLHFTNPLIEQGLFVQPAIVAEVDEVTTEEVTDVDVAQIADGLVCTCENCGNCPACTALQGNVTDNSNICEGTPTDENVASAEDTKTEDTTSSADAKEETTAPETAETTVSDGTNTWTEDPMDPKLVYPTTTVNLRSIPDISGQKLGQASIEDAFTATAVVKNFNGEACFFYKIGDSTFIAGDYVSFEKTVAVTGNYVPHVIEGIEYYTCGNTVTIPSGGYNVSKENIGLKVIWVNKALLGTTNAKYTNDTVNAVKNAQTNAGLEATGVVDLATWLAIGYSEDEWYNLAAYITPCKVSAGATHAECVAAMIETAIEYMNAGTDYRIGSSGKPGQYADCSGFVFQLLYSIGVNPTINIIDHGLASKEYTSRDLCADDRLGLPVSYEDMQEGDIIFYSSNGYNVTHVAIYAGGGKMYDSNSGGVLKRNIWNRSTIVKIVRVCPD